jgi:hypothetical protein
MTRCLTILAVAGMVLAAPGAAQAKLVYDVTQPSDTLVRIDGVDDGDGAAGSPPPAEGVEKAIDNNFQTKYLNFLDLGSGLEVTLDAYGAATLAGIGLTTANDAPARDPASVTVTGSNDGLTWSPVVTAMATPLPDMRYTDVEFAFTPETAGDFSMYRVVFPTVKGDNNSMQIGEVRLVGDDGTAMPAALPDVTNRGDPVRGSSFNHPAGETPAMAIDNDPGTKYLNFDKEGSGLIVILSSAEALTGIGLTTANDAPARDPASVSIRGSNDGTNWVQIVTDLPTPLPDDRKVESVFGFSPETAGAYGMYEVLFPTLKDSGGANSMQIGEIRLLPEPATLALAGLGALGLALRRRRG